MPYTIAIVHSFYSGASPSGENQAVLAQARALRRAGHEVHILAARTDELSRTALYTARAALTVATGRGRSPLAGLRNLRPDVVHVHNLFPNFGRSWLRHWNGTLLATLHNYRPLCAAATLYRDGAHCTRCPDGDRWAGLRHGCYRGSPAATAPLAWAGRKGPAADALLCRADRLIVLSETGRRVYCKAGVPPHRMTLLPNFTTAPPADPHRRPAGSSGPAGTRWVFAGRISAEKGLLELLRLWPAGEPLDVVGEGPLMEQCRAAAPPAVRFLGVLEQSDLRRRMPSWRGLVFPSRVLEGAPLIYPEALCAGLPVLAFAGSAVADMVHRHGTGTVVRWDEPLGTALAHAAERFPALRPVCRATYRQHYTEDIWIRRMEALYAAALGRVPTAPDGDVPATAAAGTEPPP